DVKRVVVDEGGLLRDVADDLRGAAHIPDRRRAPGHQNEEHPRAHRVLREVLLSDLMLTLTPLTLDHRDSPRSCPGPHPAGRPPRPHASGAGCRAAGPYRRATAATTPGTHPGYAPAGSRR